MKAKPICRDEQIRLVMECRTSGLFDYQWCEAHGILPGTFYNWVSKLRKAGITIPDSESKRLGTPVHQEVVKVDLVPDSHTSTTIMEQNACTLPLMDNCVAMEIATNNSTIRFFNNTNPELIRMTLQCLGGMSHAW